MRTHFRKQKSHRWYQAGSKYWFPPGFGGLDFSGPNLQPERYPMRYDHQTFQVPKMEVLTYVSCMDRAYGRENPPPKIAENKVLSYPPF